MKSRLAVCGVALSLVVLSAAAARMEARQAMADPSQHAVVTPDQVMFQPIEVPGFKSGMKIAAIHGDPNAMSGTYVIRLQFPAGYTFPAHWHPNTENLTVLSGELQLGMGGKEDASKLVSYKPGTFVFIPPKMPHFGGAMTETVIQLHGEAPFKIELANKM
ncbi:MAG TPA: cupin domain-containing protein [Vicinamibacterales bacterium]|jgi:quercetin dioxygenase-like cupin family protein|nr:cupin domain-containing protein [Vicinamibacterales bacterium]